jgi:hypothetical protein
MLEEQPCRPADLPFGAEQILSSCQVDRAHDDHSTVAPLEPVQQRVIETGHVTQKVVELVQPQHRRSGTPGERRVPQDRREDLRARGRHEELGGWEDATDGLVRGPCLAGLGRSGHQSHPSPAEQLVEQVVHVAVDVGRRRVTLQVLGG